MEVWKTLGAPLIVAVVGSLSVGLLLGRLQSPEVPALSARVHWVEVPNPLHEVPYQHLDDVKKLLIKLGATDDNVILFSLLRRERTLKVGSIIFSNNGSVRSKEIELSTRTPAAGFFSLSAKPEDKPFSQTLKLPRLAPDETVEVLGVGSLYYDYIGHQFLALHDGKKINISSSTIPREFSWLTDALVTYPHPYLPWLADGSNGTDPVYHTFSVGSGCRILSGLQA